MNSKEVKQVRGQVRIAVKEELPDLLKGAAMVAINKDLTKLINARLDALTEHVDKALKAIDERSKEVQSYLVRNTAPQAPTPSTETPAVSTELQ